MCYTHVTSFTNSLVTSVVTSAYSYAPGNSSYRDYNTFVEFNPPPVHINYIEQMDCLEFMLSDDDYLPQDRPSIFLCTLPQLSVVSSPELFDVCDNAKCGGCGVCDTVM